MDIKSRKRLFNLTKELLDYNDQSVSQFRRIKSEPVDPDFFNVVKPTMDKLEPLITEWGELALKWLSTQQRKTVYPLQVNNTTDNLRITTLQAFYPDTKKKRFLELTSSIEYVLKELLKSEEKD